MSRHFLYLYIHFGPFLNEKIDSREKEKAYCAIIDFLDGVENMEFPPELETYLRQGFDTLRREDMEQIHTSYMDTMEDIDAYMDENKESIEAQLKFRESEAFRDSPAYTIRQLLVTFQQNSGYYDVFIPNLKIVSDSYRGYMEKVEKANAAFLAQYPQAEDSGCR